MTTREKVEKWQLQIQRTTDDFKNQFEGLSPEQLNWKPKSDTWSIAQNIDHLITINETYFPIPDQIRSGTYKLPFHGRFVFMTNFLGNFILNSSDETRRKKIKTMTIWEPASSQIPGDILQKFVRHQEKLKEFIATSEDLLDKQIIISSPASRQIVYSLEKGFDIIVAHERRHLAQAKEVLELLVKG